jgi:HPt (histidine-containing phosphotransfer) domain-containing protein
MEFEERIMSSKHNPIARDADHQPVLPARISLVAAPEVAVDMAMLNDLAAAQVAGEPDIIVELIDLFLADALRRMIDMQAAIAATDALALRRAAHALKGSSANLGARQMSALCAELEALDWHDAWPSARALRIRLQQAFAHVRQVFTAERQRRM